MAHAISRIVTLSVILAAFVCGVVMFTSNEMSVLELPLQSSGNKDLLSDRFPSPWVKSEDGSYEIPGLDTVTWESASSFFFNRTVVIAGDSVSRYRYLSLVHFLLHKEFPNRFRYKQMQVPLEMDDGNGSVIDSANDNDVNNNMDHSYRPSATTAGTTVLDKSLLWEGDWMTVDNGTNKSPESIARDWNNWYEATDEIFFPNGSHICDCVRTGSTDWHDISHENRYTWVESSQTLLIYLQMWGTTPMFGCTPMSVWQHLAHRRTTYTEPANARSEAKARECRANPLWGGQLSDVLGQLQRDLGRPVDLLAFNYGFHGVPRDELFIYNVLAAGSQLTGLDGYRYLHETTFSNIYSESDQEKLRMESTWRSPGVDWGYGYFDYWRLTMALPDDAHASIDGVHFEPWVYEQLNRHMLKVVIKNPNGNDRDSDNGDVSAG